MLYRKKKIKFIFFIITVVVFYGCQNSNPGSAKNFHLVNQKKQTYIDVVKDTLFREFLTCFNEISCDSFNLNKSSCISDIELKTITQKMKLKFLSPLDSLIDVIPYSKKLFNKYYIITYSKIKRYNEPESQEFMRLYDFEGNFKDEVLIGHQFYILDHVETFFINGLFYQTILLNDSKKNSGLKVVKKFVIDDQKGVFKVLNQDTLKL